MIFCQKRNSPDKAKKAKRWDVLSPPAQDSSHHPDYYIFSRESRTKPSFATGILGGGTTQVIVLGLPLSGLPFTTQVARGHVEFGGFRAPATASRSGYGRANFRGGLWNPNGCFQT